MPDDDSSPRIECDFLILAAQDSEISSLLTQAEHLSDEMTDFDHVHYIHIPSPTSENRGLVGAVARSGIGRVEAALTASRLLRMLSPSVLLLVGIAGGFEENGALLGDIVVADHVIDYEYQRLSDETTEIRFRSYDTDPMLLAASSAAAAGHWYASLHYTESDPPRLHFGPMLSGDKVVASKSAADFLLKRQPSVLGVEMEGGGVAAAAAYDGHRIRFLMIRGIVDMANNRKREDAEVWLSRTCDAVALFTIATLREASHG